MKRYFFTALLFLLSKLPLSWLHALGSAIGILSDKFSKRTSTRLRSNLLRTNMCNSQSCENMARLCAKEWGKTIVETACISWQWSRNKVAGLITHADGLDLVQNELNNGKAIIFLTPHIGNFEIALKYTATQLEKHQFTVLYKPSKDKNIETMMKNGRGESNIKPVPTNRHGVMALIKALRRGEIVGILPDNVASMGDGVWVDFFGVPVYAMTLAAKLTTMENSATFLVNSIRHDNGFSVQYIPFTPQSSDVTEIIQNMYRQFEKMILMAPSQYYWSYDRFRTPKHASQKPETETKNATQTSN